MAPMRGLWVLLLVLYFDSANSQWGLNFGWFWGNLEDLKSSTVESGVVKSSSFIPGSRTKTSLFGSGDGSSSEEDSFAILSSLVDRQGRNKPYRSRNVKGVGKKTRMRKYRKRNKTLRKTQQYRKGLQAIRKRYNDHVRRKYSKKTQKEENKYTQQNTNPTEYGSQTKLSTSQGKQKTTTLEEIVNGISGSQGSIIPTEYGSQSSRPVPPGARKTSTLEEIVNGSYGSQSSQHSSMLPGLQPNKQKEVSRSQQQGTNSNTKGKNSRNGSHRDGNTEATTRGGLEVEYENETEATDAPESEGQSTLPTTTTTELTTPEVEYEKEYYDGMDLFGFGTEVFGSDLGLSGGENINENGVTMSLTKTQEQNGNTNTQRKGQKLNTQASPLNSNDVAAKALEMVPHSAHNAQNTKTMSNGSQTITKKDFKTGENSAHDAKNTKTMSNGSQTNAKKDFKTGENSAHNAKKNKTVSNGSHTNTKKDFKTVESSPLNVQNPKTASNGSHTNIKKDFETGDSLSGSLPAVTKMAPVYSTEAKHLQQNKNLKKSGSIPSQRSGLRKPQTVSIPKEAEKRFLMKHSKVPHTTQKEKTGNQFNLHADHPQAWKSYDIINPQQKLLTNGRNDLQSSKTSSSGQIKEKQIQRQMSASSIQSDQLSKMNGKSSKGSDFKLNMIGGQEINQVANKEVTLVGQQIRNNQNVRTQHRVGSGRGHYMERESFLTSGVQAHSPTTHQGTSSTHENSEINGIEKGKSFSLGGSNAGMSANNANPRPGDNITNGKNGKKINALFLTPAQKNPNPSGYSSKIEKTWVDGFLPDKKNTNEQLIKGNNPSQEKIKDNKTVPKTINSLFSLTETASEGKNAQLQQYRKQSIASKPLVPPRVHPSEMHDSASSNTISAIPKESNVIDSKQNDLRSNTKTKQSLITAIDKRPVATLSHMPSSVTAIPSHSPQTSWDGSVNDRMSYKYGRPTPTGEKSTSKTEIHRKDQTKTVSRPNAIYAEKTLNRVKQNVFVPQGSVNSRNRLQTTGDTQTISPRFDAASDKGNDIRQAKTKEKPGFVEKTNQRDQTKARLNVGTNKMPQKAKPPNLISEGFPSRMSKKSSNTTAEGKEMIPDIPGQGDVHIKLPEIPTRLTKALGQGDRTNSHQKSPPAPPVVVEQIQIPNKSVFSFPNSNKTEEAESTSIDGRLANLQTQKEANNKLKLTLLETEQKPHSRTAAPNAVKSNKGQEAKTRLIQAQNIQLIPYSNAIPLDNIIQKQQKQFKKRPSLQSSTNMHGLGKRYDKPFNRHGLSKMQSNTVEKHPNIKRHPNHKSVDTFRLTSAEMMSYPNIKERKPQMLTTNKIANQNHINSTKAHHKRTGGGRNIIPEMKFQIKKKAASLVKIVSPNAREYQTAPVKVEKISKYPKVSLLSKYQKKPVQKPELNAINGIKRSSFMGSNTQAVNDHEYKQHHPNAISSSNGLKKMVGSGRVKLSPKPVVAKSPKTATTVGENEAEQIMNGSANKIKPPGGLKTTSNPVIENEIEAEGGMTTLQTSSNSTSPISVSGETENEGEEEQTVTSRLQQTTQQPVSTQQDDLEYEYEYEYSTTKDVNGRTGVRKDPSVVGTAGDNIFSGSWKDAARQNAREIAIEMEGTWKAVNASVIGRQNTCPPYKMRYQGNAVVFDTIDEQCRVIITWNKRQQREQVKEKLWWGINTYYRSRSVYVPVVTYVDLR